MQKGFTLAETLITMAVIGIIMALSIPAVIQSTNDTKPLFKKAYNSVEEVVNELINDTSIYPSGDLSAAASGTTYCSATDLTNGLCFCQNFFSKLNTIGTITCTAAAAVTPTVTVGTPNTTNADATATNAMNWYNFHSTVAAKATSGFTAANCQGVNNGNITTIADGAGQDTCVKISVDVNGMNKGANTNTGQANQDIFDIYVTAAGKVTVAKSVANDYDEASLLQN
jgi:prepilin-type N-terminal cleavage/methylation domain-containing protein